MSAPTRNTAAETLRIELFSPVMPQIAPRRVWLTIPTLGLALAFGLPWLIWLIAHLLGAAS